MTVTACASVKGPVCLLTDSKGQYHHHTTVCWQHYTAICWQTSGDSITVILHSVENIMLHSVDNIILHSVDRHQGTVLPSYCSLLTSYYSLLTDSRGQYHRYTTVCWQHHTTGCWQHHTAVCWQRAADSINIVCCQITLDRFIGLLAGNIDRCIGLLNIGHIYCLVGR